MKATYITHSGDDILVVNAARVSMYKQSAFDPCTGKLKDADKKLLKYLATHNHWTPFSHPQITLVEKVPIFIARQRFKHMVGFTYNEVSRRYVDSEPEFYEPDSWRSRPEGSVKQGSGGIHENSKYIKRGYEWLMEEALGHYSSLIEDGVAPEQARMVLPQSMYTEFYVTGSLAAWARAYKQRSDPHAQKEIQDLAAQWDSIIKKLYPESWKVLTAAAVKGE